MVSKGSIVLDPKDEFERLLISIIETQRLKRQDYANDEDLVLSLRRTAYILDLPGYTALEDALAMVARKFSRIINLRDREPENEAIIDSIDDLVTYALFAKHLMVEDDAG